MSSSAPLDLRLLPLLSSATEIVHALGLGSFQVGRSHECNFPAEVAALPACTRAAVPQNASSREIDFLVRQRTASLVSIYEVDSERLRQLRPTHIITQTQCDVCAVSLADVQRAVQQQLDMDVEVVPLEAFSLEGLWTDIQRVSMACGKDSLGDQLVASLQNRLAQIAGQMAAAPHIATVACIEWTDPLMSAGNWVPELIDIAGGRSLLAEPGHHSPYLTFESLREADPDVIIGMPCGFGLERAYREMQELRSNYEWRSLRAVQAGHVYACDGNNYMNRSGPRLVESAQILAEILHPELFSPGFEGSGWLRVRL